MNQRGVVVRGLLVAVACVVVAVVLGTCPAAEATMVASPTPTYVYTQTNAASGNAVVGFRWTGSALVRIGSWRTGGRGSGVSLASQGAIVARDGFVYAVNAGSNDVSMLSVGTGGALTLRARVYAGVGPVSVDVHGDDVVVQTTRERLQKSGLCARVHCDGVTLLRRSGSGLRATQHVIVSGQGAAQVAIAPSGDRVMITERVSNSVQVMTLRSHALGSPVRYAASATTPYGFAIARTGTVVVSNAENDRPNGSTVSSYRFTGPSRLVRVTPRLTAGQTAACWLALTSDERGAYVTNPGSHSISQFSIASDGRLAVRRAVAAHTEGFGLDLQVSGGLVFVTSHAPSAVEVFAIRTGGGLAPLASAPVAGAPWGMAVVA